MAKTPKQLRDEALANFREKLAEVLCMMPKYWLFPFLHKFPQYAGQETHIRNVAAGRSADNEVLSRMQDLAKLLKPVNE